MLYALHAIAGLGALSWFRALLAALTFTLAFLFASREGDPPLALALSCAAFAGAVETLDVRPSAMAALFVPIAIHLASRERFWPYLALTVVWINVHPAALLAPVIWLAVRQRDLGLSKTTAGTTAALCAALLVNPFGWRAIAAPIRLLGLVGGGEFVNVEWLPSPVTQFPLLYILIAIGVAAFAFAWRDHIGRALLFALLAWLAARHVRHQGLFLAAYPLLVAPMIRLRLKPVITYGAAAAAVLVTALTTEHGTGPQPARFPIESVAHLQAAGLKGNIYNPDQFGGYLIWAFYPERRALTDGRNELHHTFIREFAQARLDERKWRELLRRHSIVLAVDEYRPPLPVVSAKSGEQRLTPASLAYWPRREWALIGYDDVSMAFARRSAFTGIEKWEIRGVVPDAPR